MPFGKGLVPGWRSPPASSYRKGVRILVTGAKGLLGQAVVAEALDRRWSVIGAGRDVLDVRDPAACASVVGEVRPDAVVHCAAYTNVDGAEDEEPLALEVNRDGARNVAEAAMAVDAVMVFPSTDYVFDGTTDQPYHENDEPAPLGAYGRSKLAGEEAVRALGVAHLIVRTSWLYGSGGRNFVDTIRTLAAERDELRVVSDQRGRPTWSTSLARGVLDLLAEDARGTLHACDSGSASWIELARSILEIIGLEARLVPVTTAEWNARAPRPRYSVMALDRAETILGHPFPHWRESLASYLRGEP